MNVDSARSVEIQPLESAREKSGAKGTGFPELMEAVLGRPAEKAKASRSQSDEPVENRAQGRAPRGDAGAARKKEAREGEPDVAAEARVSANPAPKAKGKAEVQEEKNARPVVDGETAEAQPPVEAPAWQVAAALALPELVAMASGVAVDAEAQAEGAPSNGETEETERAASAGEVVASEPVPGGEPEVADAVVRSMPIVESAAREAAAAVVGTATAKGAEKDEPAVNAAAEAPVREVVEQVVRSVVDAAGIRAESKDLRAPVAGRESRSSEIDASAQPANREGLPVQTTASADVGSDGSPRDGQTPAESRTNAAAARAGTEAAAVGAASPQSPTNTLAESSVRGTESAAPAAVDATAPPVSTPATEAASPTAPQRAESVHAGDAIAIQADWLATRGGGSARIVLHPPELGEIVIRVSVRQQAVDVVMVAQTALARTMAEDQSDRLAQAFAHRDLRLDQFEVRRADPSDSSATAQFGSSDAGARERERAEDQGGVQDGAAGRGSRNRWAGAGEAAVQPPRFVPTERASGVDLRI